mmetsp:Transcript_27652/g.46830  ORF Transcript_27652/g.46830 Transcript_27652/m.46830 type:complete len:339 (+) Transcript_27652:82-1098(+)
MKYLLLDKERSPIVTCASTSSSSLCQLPPPPPPPPQFPPCSDNSIVDDLPSRKMLSDDNANKLSMMTMIRTTSKNKKKETEEIMKAADRMRRRREEERRKRNNSMKNKKDVVGISKKNKEGDEEKEDSTKDHDDIINLKEMKKAEINAKDIVSTKGGKGGQLKAQQDEEIEGLQTTTTKNNNNNKKKKKKALSKHIEYPGDLEFIQKALDSKEFDLAGKDMFGLTALHKFASWNKTDLIEAIAPHLTGPQFNQQTPKEKDTALHLAVKMGAARAVFMLVSSPKIDISIRNKKNETALEVAQGVYGRSNTCKDDDAPMSQIFLCLSSAFKQLNKKDDLT